MKSGKQNVFISGSSNSKKINEFFEGSSDAYFAVAFWGADSIPLLERSISKFPKKQFKIICNFTSGATNPEFVRFCIKHQKQIQIKNSSNLHAKVIFSLERYIVGSSNISANGLGHEDNEIKGWMESSIFGSDLDVLKDIKKWFKTEWKNADEVTDLMIAKADEDWKKRRVNRIVLKNEQNSKVKTRNLLDAILEKPQVFRDKNIYIAIFRSYISDEAREVHDNYKEEVSGDNLASYENWEKIPENSYLVDIYFGLKGKVKVHGFNYIPNHPHRKKIKYDDGDNGEILFGKVVDEIEGYKKFCDSKVLSKDLIQELFDLGEGDEEGKIVEIAKFSKVFNKMKTEKHKKLF